MVDLELRGPTSLRFALVALVSWHRSTWLQMVSLSELYGIDREIWKGRDVKKEVLELREKWDKGFRERVEP